MSHNFDLVVSRCRAVAIDRGELVDVSEQAAVAGHPFPTAVTRKAWESVVALTPVAAGLGLTEVERLARMLRKLTETALERLDPRPHFDVDVIRSRPTPTRTRLRAEYGPDDNGRTVITIMMPWEE